MEPGANVRRVADKLEERGLITDARKFLLLARYKKWDSRLQAGRFALNTGWLPEQVLDTLVNGQPVLAETADYGAVVRNYTRGRSTVMLTADSHSGEYDDILAGPGDAPVVCKGRVVWYMGERDERQYERNSGGNA